MSQFAVTVVRLGKVGKHPNADALEITTIEGCPCITRAGDFKEGDVAVYVPVEAVVPETVPGTEFLGSKRRIRAMRLRGIFSMGLLLPHSVLAGYVPYEVPVGLGSVVFPTIHSFGVGYNVAPVLGITKYEEPEPTHMQTDAAAPPKTMHQPPVYDVESYRKYKRLLVQGEEVVVTEKLHGCSSRFVYLSHPSEEVDSKGYGTLHVGSHRGWKKAEPSNLWWKIADKYDLADKLSAHPEMIVYAETYGRVQDLRYGLGDNDYRMAVFDVYDANLGMWLDYDHNEGGAPVYSLTEFCNTLELPMAPVLYKGPYIPEMVEPLCDGDSVVSLTKQIREGFVIRPVQERWNQETGRTVLKLIGEAYQLRKGGTERH
jgi:RNA ligase (TIGR02306 family)